MHRCCHLALAPLLFLAVALSHPTGASEGETDNRYLAVISPPPAISSLTANQARAIFSMRVRTWPDGSRITVFILPEDDTRHQQFIRSQLSLLPHQLRRNWQRLVYTGIGQAPITVADEREMLDRLRQIPGSVGYLSEATIDREAEDLYAVTLR